MRLTEDEEPHMVDELMQPRTSSRSVIPSAMISDPMSDKAMGKPVILRIEGSSAIPIQFSKSAIPERSPCGNVWLFALGNWLGKHADAKDCPVLMSSTVDRLVTP